MRAGHNRGESVLGMASDFTQPSKSSEDSGYDERKITQLRELKTLLWSLDLDEGIRFIADVPGYKEGAFVFITKSNDQYCVSLRDKVMDEKINQVVPGGREQMKYFETAESLWNYVSKFLKPPFEAYYY